MPYIMMKLQAPADALKPLGDKMKLLMKAQGEAADTTPEVQAKLAGEIKKTRDALDAKVDKILLHCADGETNSASYDQNITKLHEAAKKTLADGAQLVKDIEANGYDETKATRVNGLLNQLEQVQQRMSAEGANLMANMSDYRANGWWKSIVEHASWRDKDVETTKKKRQAGIDNNQKVAGLQKRVKEYITRNETLKSAVERIKGTEEKDYIKLRERIIELVKEIENYAKTDWGAKRANTINSLITYYKELKPCKSLSEANELTVKKFTLMLAAAPRVLKEVRGKLKTYRGKVDEFAKNFPDLRNNDRYFKPQIDKAYKLLDAIAKEEAESSEYEKKASNLMKKLK
ncbi:MAG: hypothetical protein EA381_21005 [Planctomycetaceae bacterium]|nr:MAG: hypothetical protein EA381_21005 [Planctomycetaceae bacterium]